MTFDASTAAELSASHQRQPREMDDDVLGLIAQCQEAMTTAAQKGQREAYALDVPVRRHVALTTNDPLLWVVRSLSGTGFAVSVVRRHFGGDGDDDRASLHIRW